MVKLRRTTRLDGWARGGCLATLLVAAPAAVAAQDPPLDREASVIDTFRDVCFFGPTDFDVIDRRATALHMKLMLDRSPPPADDVAYRNKIWNGTLADRPFGLFLDEMDGRKGAAIACAVSTDVPDVDAFRARVVEALRLPVAPAPSIAGGERSFVWEHLSGQGNRLILRDLSPSGKPGVMIKFVSLQKR